MKVKEMVRLFRANGVPDHYYAIDGGLGGGECHGISLIDQRWTFYYSERGERSPLQSFDTEDEACNALIKCIDKIMLEDKKRKAAPKRRK